MLSHAARTKARSARRVASYWLVGLGLGLVYVALRGSSWQGSVALHTLMEVAATLLAAVVGAMALVRFYSAKGNIFLFVGTGFLGAALLDGYHALVTSVWFAPYLPSDLPSLIPWSWIASRLFLSLMLALSWLAWTRERRLGAAGRIGEGAVYLGAGLLTLASFLFFAFVPLPRAYYPELVFHRPEELAPALLFLVALAGYLRKGDWRRDPFEHWLVLALIVGLVAQAAFMSFSDRLFDMAFDAAHLLKKVSYVFVLTGLLISMLAIHRRAEERGDRIRAVVDNAVDGIITIDARGTILSFNPAATALFGLAAGDAIGRNVRVLMPAPYREEHDGYLESYLRTGEAKIIGIGRELVGLRADGTTFPMELAVSEMHRAGAREFVGICRDISVRNKAELALRRHVAALARSNAELEQFAYIASHDLQEPLRKVRAFSDRLHGKYGNALDVEGRDFLVRIGKAAQRMQQLVNDLLDYSRVTTKGDDFTDVDLGRVARDVADDLEAGIEDTGAKLEISDMPIIEATPLQMRQLFQNLIGNALKYHREGVPPVIQVSAELLENGSIRPDGSPERTCRIMVRDNGLGFEEQYAERIFGIFQRLHGRGRFEGTGIGLAICRKIAERHGGTVTAEGRPGEGATFTVTLMAARDRSRGLEQQEEMAT